MESLSPGLLKNGKLNLCMSTGSRENNQKQSEYSIMGHPVYRWCVDVDIVWTASVEVPCVGHDGVPHLPHEPLQGLLAVLSRLPLAPGPVGVGGVVILELCTSA